MTCSPPSAPVTVAIFGDRVVSRAPVALLQGLHYDATFLPSSSSGESGLLNGMPLELLGLTPGLIATNISRCVASLVDSAVASGIPILELATSFGRTQVREGRDGT